MSRGLPQARARHDLIVVGGGVIGTMTALLAARRHPEWRVLVVDRSLIGSGASMYSAYMDFPFGPGAEKRAMAVRSAALWAELRPAMALAIRDVALIGLCSEDRLDAVRAGLVGAPRIERGPQVAARLSRTIAGFEVPPGSAAITGLWAAACSDRGLAATFTDELVRDGRGRTLEGVEVARVTPCDGAIEIATRDGRALAAPRVALCLGPWLAGSLHELAGAAAPVRVKKVVSLHVPVAPPGDAPLIYLFDDEAFLLPQPEHRRWLFSFRSEEWDCQPEISRLFISAADRARAAAILGRCWPAAVELELGGRVFCDAYTATGAPWIEAIPGVPGCIAAGGGSGSGFRLAPGIAERAVDLLTAHSAGGPS